MDIRSSILWFAADNRLAMDKPFIVAITGSVAKTSTKEAVGAVLEHAYGKPQVRVGFGNLNTELGLPLAILGFKVDFYKQRITWQWPFILLAALVKGFYTGLPRYLVLEMGADKLGDIAKMTRHVTPDIGIITIIGEAHLMNYQSIDELASEKAELIAATKPKGVALVYKRDQFHDYLVGQTKAHVVSFDCATADIAHTVAETVGKQLDIKPEIIGIALASAWKPEGRMQVYEGTYTVIDDSYNASPTSMKAALEKLRGMPGRKVAILGSMLELGPEEVRFHQEVGEYAKENTDLVIGVGELARNYSPTHWYATSEEAAHEAVAFLQKGDSILVKGSHGIRTDKIVEKLI